MNTLQDPTKKPSINSLLNPQESTAHPVGANDDQNQSNQSSPMFQYGPVTSYHLRAANWDPDNDPHKRRPINGAHNMHRPYQQHPTSPQTPSLHGFGDLHASRHMMRPRIDESSLYPSEAQVWPPKHLQPYPQQHQLPHHHADPGMPYPSIMYSDERTALSGDYQSQNHYPSTYEEPSTLSPDPQSWQQAERASLRLAARGTISDPQQQQTQQDARYSPSSYYTHPNIYSPPYSPEQLQPLQLPQQLVVPETTQTLSEPASRLSSTSTPSSSSKRQPQEEESTLAPKAKRAKAKTKSAPGSTPAPGPSKRGYNAKKRSEAALITAQNDAFQRVTVSSESYSNGALSTAVNAVPSTPNSAMTQVNSVAFIPELQYARCMSNRYRGEVFSRCVSCTRRWAGDTCRFQGIRYLLRGPDKKISCVSFREHHQTVDPPIMQFPTVWNRRFKREHLTRTKLSIAKALLPTLKLEREHLKAGEVVRRPRESEVRATCDTCMTSLFSASWMCRVCGREVCHECFLQVHELTSEPTSASQAELAALQGKREKHAHSNPFFLSCNKRAEHGVREFTPVTRFWNEELEKAIEEMEGILKGRAEDCRENVTDTRSNERYNLDPNSSPLSSPPPSDPIAAGTTPAVYDSYLPSNLSARVRSIPVYKLQQIPASLYDPVPSPPSSPSHTNSSSSSSASVPPSFTSLWTLGAPILVKDVLPRFKLTWTPEYFMQQYGEQSCLVIECQTDTNKRISVREFFEQFGKYEGRTECWKLKDWPPSTDFKSAFPELFEDFSQAVPVPDYVRRDGVFNLGSHFPSNTVAPDLGPKMYNSMASSQEPGSKGSTRLHMDMADALNVMLYASKCEDGTEGYAVWDLFRAEDSDKLRGFLRKKFGQPQNGSGLGAIGGGGGGGSSVPIAHDPIHGQQFYLDVELRQALFEECGVKSYRLYQRPGDGVFIPAGCAHQVANMSDCMKVAIDFVSPENIDRCEKLTKEFREQNQSKVWKEDVLQLRTMMWKGQYFMTKPTFIQSLLNQPSQSYSDRSMTLKPPPPTAYRQRLSYNEFEDLEPSEESDLEDLFFTPNTSPRTSMASSLLMFPTGRKPSRRSLRLSDSSDTVVAVAAAAARPSPPASPTTSRAIPPTSSVPSTRTPSTTRQHPQKQRNAHVLSTASSLSSTSLEPHSVLSDYAGPTTNLDDKNKGRGITKRTRHGSVTLPSPTTNQTESAKSTTTTSTRKNSLADGDVTKDFKRSVSPPSSSPSPAPATNGSASSKRKSVQQGLADGDVTKRSVPTPTASIPPVSATNGSAVTATSSKRKSVQQGLADGDSTTKDIKRSVTSSPPSATTSSTSNGSVKITPNAVGQPSRKSSKSTNSAPAATTPKEKAKQDVAETEVPSANKTKEKEKEVDSLNSSSSSKSRIKDKGKAKATPHTFSAFAPLVVPSSSTPPANGNANSSNNKPSLPPAGFSFPPPPPHSPQQPQQQQPKQSLNGSAAAYTYAHRQKGNSSPKPGGANVSGSIMMNMAALLEEDEVDAEGGDGNSPARRLRRVPNGNGNGQSKGKGKEKRMSDSTSDSSHQSFSLSPSRSNANSPPNSYSESTFRNPPKTLTSEVNAMTLSTPGELPSKGTQGYTSLILPRAPLPLGTHSTSIRTTSTSGSGSRKWFGSVGKEGRIDLTRSGVAHTTMASVEVVRGLGRQQGQNGLGGKLLGILRKRTISGGAAGPRPIEGLGKSTANEDLPVKKAPTTAAGVEGTVLGFTSYRKPPGYIPSSSVLVQVWAVGVDGVDGRLVGVNFGDHVWRERGFGDDEGGVETEWEQEQEEVQRGDESEEVDISRSTPQQGSGFSGLGRSFSLKKMSRKQRGSVVGSQDRGRTLSTRQDNPSRSFSLKRNNTTQPQRQHTLTKSSSQKQAQRQKMLQKTAHRAEVGYIPGRSFVGRVLECGWDVRDEEIRKGEWVVGLLDIKKCGALTEFIVVDRHRIHRVPHPRKTSQGNGPSNMASEMPLQDDDNALTLEELALLPLCGIPAYRAVRTFIYAFSSLGEGGSMTSPIIAHDRKGAEFGSTNSTRMIATTEHPQDRRRRVLVLRGHDGAGAMAVQLLAKRGWKVSVHVPFSATSTTHDPTTTEAEHVVPGNIQDRARDWGADEIIFDEEAGDGIDDGRIAAIRVIESLRQDGDMFDAILDTVGGKEVREAGERLLRSAGGATTPSVYGGFELPPPVSPRARDKAKGGVGQFTTLVGDVPERPIPTTADHFRAGLRSFGAESGTNRNGDEGTGADMKGNNNKVGYAWVSVAQDVDWEGEDISETLGSVLRLALEDRVRPLTGARHRVVPFEQTPYVFVDRGPLGHGCNVVVKIAG